MALTASKRYRNWSATSFGGTAIDGIKRINFDSGFQDLREGADNDQGPTVGMNVYQQPSFTVNTINALAVLAAAGDTRGIFTTTLNDTYNGVAVGGGAMIFTTNELSYLTARSTGGDFNQLATEDFTVATVWSDGVTNPVTVSAA